MTMIDQSVRALGNATGAAESSISVAIREGALLIAQLMETSAAMNLSIESDQTIVEQAVAGLKGMTDSRAAYVAMHRRMAALARTRGIDPGAHGDCPPSMQVAEVHPIRTAA